MTGEPGGNVLRRWMLYPCNSPQPKQAYVSGYNQAWPSGFEAFCSLYS